VVVYDGGGSPDPIEAIGKIERTVWLSEPYGFDNLVVQNADQAPIIRSYAELEAALGPRQPGFAGVTLRQGALLTGFGNVAERISIGIVVAFAAAIAAALVAIAMIVFAGLRPTRTLAPDDLTNRRST
jgi:hypothetical protein